MAFATGLPECRSKIDMVRLVPGNMPLGKPSAKPASSSSKERGRTRLHFMTFAACRTNWRKMRRTRAWRCIERLTMRTTCRSPGRVATTSAPCATGSSPGLYVRAVLPGCGWTRLCGRRMGRQQIQDHHPGQRRHHPHPRRRVFDPEDFSVCRSLDSVAMELPPREAPCRKTAGGRVPRILPMAL